LRSLERRGKRMVETTSFSHFLETVGALSTLIFVLTSLLGMGFSLTVQQILAPLSNRKLVIFSLAANFILVPLLTLGVLFIFPPSEGLSIRLFLLGTSAGASFLPKLAQVAKVDTAFAVGLMVLLMVVTIIYVPIVLPLLLSRGYNQPPGYNKAPYSADTPPTGVCPVRSGKVQGSFRLATTPDDPGYRSFPACFLVAFLLLVSSPKGFLFNSYIPNYFIAAGTGLSPESPGLAEFSPNNNPILLGSSLHLSCLTLGCT
jgi:hypothetical protein